MENTNRSFHPSGQGKSQGKYYRRKPITTHRHWIDSGKTNTQGTQNSTKRRVKPRN